MSKKLLIIIIAAVVLLGGGGAAAFFLMRGSPVQEQEQAEQEQKPPEYEGPAGLVDMETFLVNINDPRGERYAKVKVGLAIKPTATATKITEDVLLIARFRDRILTLLTGKTFEELNTPIGKEGFRREIKARLTPLVEEGEIEDVLFQEFVVQ